MFAGLGYYGLSVIAIKVLEPTVKIRVPIQ
jgi:hypothetical protein